MKNPPPLPADYLPCYEASISTCGKLTLSETNAMELLRGYAFYIAHRRTLAQMATSGSSNADLAVQARNALKDDRPLMRQRPRLVALETMG
jgi:hypothetical protein